MIEDPPFDLLCPGRRPTGIAPVLLPADEAGGADWAAFAHLLGRVADTSLLPGVNLGPGGGAWLDQHLAAEVVATTGAAMGGSTFLAGVRADPDPNGGFDPAKLAGVVEHVVRCGGVPVLLPSPALATLDPDEHVGLVAWMGDWCERLLVVEAPAERWPGGRDWGLDVFGALLEVPACTGVVHASWRRVPEWDRVRLRDDVRGDFAVFSANESAVDQIMFGTDHCLDLSAAVPDVMALRDDAWEATDPDALRIQDDLAALATVVFRDPASSVDALARILERRGWLGHRRVVGAPPVRPAYEDELLGPLLDRLGI